MVKISDVALICRSKNAGPFHVTLDVVFIDSETYERFLQAKVISRESIGALYPVALADIEIVEFPIGNAIKVTIPRYVGAGDIGDPDVYGAQQHAPLLDLELQNGSSA